MTETESPSHPLFAVLYDPLTRFVEKSLFHEYRKDLAHAVSGRVLDIGAGTGAMFPYFSEVSKSNPSLRFNAIEPDPYMRRQAEDKAATLDFDITIDATGVESLPYPDNSFDTVVASLVFCTIPDVDTALAEVSRILKTDGTFYFFEHVEANGWQAQLQSMVNPIWRRGVGGCHLDRDTASTFRKHESFNIETIERLSIGIPPVNPFIRGTLTVLR